METGISLNFDIPNDLNVDENDDDYEDEKQREKELQELLTTAFDDLEDDGGGSFCGETNSVHSQPQSQIPHLAPWPVGAYNETSTPRHEMPAWAANYTPITGELQENHYFYTPYENGIPDSCNRFTNNNTSARTSNGLNGHLSPQNISHESCDAQDQERNRTLVPQHNLYQNGHPAYHCNGLNNQDGESEVFRLKTAFEKLREESSKEICLLKHQLVLAHGEKEGSIFSLQQARQLLVDKDRDISSLHSKIQKLEDDLNNEKSANNELCQKLEVSESLVVSLQQQVNELGSYKKLTIVQESQERLMQCMKEKHQKEILELKEKLQQQIEELDSTQRDLAFMEQYFQQTIPEKMAVVYQLNQNLESVQMNSQQLLGTEALRDNQKLRLQQSEREQLEQLNNAKIQNLMEALSDLGNKITQVEKMESVPLSIHAKLLNENTKEKNELETKLKNVSNAIKNVKESNDKLSVENSKLKNEMEAIMNKHDSLMKSSIEKFHNLHKSEMANSQKELLENFEEEKSNLCTFYEEKVACVRSEMKQLTRSLDEVKEMYIKVCEERNDFEARLQKLLTVENHTIQELDSHCQKEFDEQLAKAKRSLEEVAAKKYSNELSKLQENWARAKVLDIKHAMQLVGEAFTYCNMLFTKEKERICKRLDALQVKLQRTLQLQRTPRWEDREKLLHAHFLQDQNKLIVHTKEELNRQWQGKVVQVEHLYKCKLTEIEMAQQKELDNIMAEVRKAMIEEKDSLLNKHKEIVLQLKKEIVRLDDQLVLTRKSQLSKQNVAVTCTLDDERADGLEKELISTKEQLAEQVKMRLMGRELLFTCTSVLNVQDSDEQLKKQRNVCNRCSGPISEQNSRATSTIPNGSNNASEWHLLKTANRNVYVQTEEEMVPKERLWAQRKGDTDKLRKLAEEVMQHLSTSSLQQAERLSLFIMEYYRKTENKRQ